jgi:hypothetical protein
MGESHCARKIENHFLIKNGILNRFLLSLTFPKRPPKNQQEPRTVGARTPSKVLDKKFKKIK